MALKAFVKSLEEVPEALHQYYVQIDDKDASSGYQLATDDSSMKSKLAEFRTNNTKLREERERLENQLKTYEGIDPVRARKAFDALSKLEVDEERKLIEEGKIDEVVGRRTKVMADDYGKRLKAKEDAFAELHGKYEKAAGELKRIQVERAVAAAIDKQKIRVRQGAMVDVLNRTHSLFRYEDEGKLVAYEGESPAYNKDGDPLTMLDHIQSLTESAPYLFEPASGGGSNGSGGIPATKGGKIVIKADDAKGLMKYREQIESGEAIVTGYEQ